VAGIFDKLQLKDQADIVVLDAPDSFEKQIKVLQGVRVHRKFSSAASGFSLAFLTTQAQLERLARSIGAHVQGDAVVWVAYPKGTSRRYKSELNRDCGWKPLADLGYETVRMVAIDDDWSALRFRKAEFVGTSGRRTGK
jgi:hypothetical protein